MTDQPLIRSLAALRCPITRQPLSLLSSEELDEANQTTGPHMRRHLRGEDLEAPITLAMGTPDREFVYRIEDGIAWLLPELATVRATNAIRIVLSSEKQSVQTFYEEFGWIKGESGLFNDTSTFTDVRPNARFYQQTCNTRIARRLTGGRFLLDVASGAIPHPEYLRFSDNFDVRVCVDFSIRALREARAQLGDKGIYLLGDITQLPLVDGAMDAVISLHTIYHLPKEEQALAIDEVARVTAPGGRALIVYTWDRSLAMSAAFGLRGFFGRLRRLGRAPNARQTRAPDKNGPPPLYFQPQGYDWFRREVAGRHSARLRVWSAASNSFQSRFLSEGRLGRGLANLLLLFEECFPWLAGRFGMYPMFIIEARRR